MSEKTGTGDKVLYFLIGGFFGAAVALLFAPRRGEDMRELISQRTREGKEFVGRKFRELEGQADEMIAKGKEVVSRQKEQIAAAVEAGKQAYRDEKEKGKPQ